MLKFKSAKGQMFLITSVVIVSMLVILKVNIASGGAERQLITMQTRMENYMFDNFKAEFNNTIDYSSHAPENITKNVFDFGNFTESKMEDHSIGFKMFYLGMVANETTNKLGFTAINMMDKTINVVLSLDGQQKSVNNLPDYGNWTDVYDIDPGTDYTMIITYDTYSYQFELRTEQHNDVYIGYSHLTFETEDASHVSKTHRTLDV